MGREPRDAPDPPHGRARLHPPRFERYALLKIALIGEFERMASVEVMTACENVCRDFGWIFDVDPRIIQGFLTFLAGLSASIAALIVAFVAYPWQREKDRVFELQREQRSVYREFITTMNNFFTAIIGQKTEQATEQQMVLHKVASDFLCFSSTEAAAAARVYIDAMQRYRAITFRREKQKRKILLHGRRREPKLGINVKLQELTC